MSHSVQYVPLRGQFENKARDIGRNAGRPPGPFGFLIQSSPTRSNAVVSMQNPEIVRLGVALVSGGAVGAVITATAAAFSEAPIWIEFLESPV